MKSYTKLHIEKSIANAAADEPDREGRMWWYFTPLFEVDGEERLDNDSTIQIRDYIAGAVYAFRRWGLLPISTRDHARIRLISERITQGYIDNLDPAMVADPKTRTVDVERLMPPEGFITSMVQRYDY